MGLAILPRETKRFAVAAFMGFATLASAGVDEGPGSGADYGDIIDSACPVCSDGADLIERVEASSELAGTRAAKYHAQQAVDGKQDTAWCEGKKGTGVGESLTVTFREPVYIAMVQLWGGYFKSPKVLADNSRLARVKLEFDGADAVVLRLYDPVVTPANVPPGKGPESGKSSFERASQWPVTWASGDDWFAKRKLVRKIRVTILDVHRVARFEDLCVSDLKFTVATAANLKDLD